MTTYKFKYGGTPDVTKNKIFSDARIEKYDNSKSNICKFSCATVLGMVIGDEAEIYNSDDTLKFKGVIQKIVDQVGTIQFVEVNGYSIALTQTKLNEVYRATTVEAIIEDIIDNNTDFTFSSSITTGITISKIVFKDDTLIDAINKLCGLFNGIWNVSNSEVFSLAIKNDTFSSKTLNFDNDLLVDGKWDTDNLPRAEKVVVLGKNINQRVTETLSGTGTVFNTTRIPEDIEIDGLTQTTASITGDYTVDKENKEITFNSSQTDPEVNYSYQSRIRVELGSGKTVVLDKPYIETVTEGIDLATSYFNRFSDGLQKSKWIKVDSDISAYTVGNKIPVTDTKNNRTGDYLINKVVFKFPKTIEIEIGESEDDLFNWQKETLLRVKELEKKDINDDFITNFELIEDNINIQANQIIELELERDLPDDYMYFGDENDSPVYANIADGTERPWKDATETPAAPEYFITDKDYWDYPDEELAMWGGYESWEFIDPIDILLQSGDNLLLESGGKILQN